VVAASVATWGLGNARVSAGAGNDALAAVREEVGRWLGLGPDDEPVFRTGAEANSEVARVEQRHAVPPLPANEPTPRMPAAPDAGERPTAPAEADNASPGSGAPAGTAPRSSPHAVLPEQLARAPAVSDRTEEVPPGERTTPAEIGPPHTAPVLSQARDRQSGAPERVQNRTDQESGSDTVATRSEPRAGDTASASVDESAHPPSPPTVSEPRTTPQVAARPPSAQAPTPPPAEVTSPASVTPPAPLRALAAAPTAPPRAMPSRPSETENDVDVANPRNRSTDIPRPRDEHIVRVVRFGDNLWTMAEDVYGYVNPNVLRKVQDANPQIRNINWLNPGQEILFPRSPEELPDRTVEILNLNQPRIRSDGR